MLRRYRGGRRREPFGFRLLSVWRPELMIVPLDAGRSESVSLSSRSSCRVLQEFREAAAGLAFSATPNAIERRTARHADFHVDCRHAEVAGSAEETSVEIRSSQSTLKTHSLRVNERPTSGPSAII